MGRNRMYWNDSMSVKAMDESMTKYKIMHGQEAVCVPAEGGVFNGCGKNDEPKRCVNEEGNVEFEVNGTRNASEANENSTVEPQQGPIEHFNLDLKGEERYNQLLNQYYELEEKRQKVLEQLYQSGAGGWNYQDVSAGSEFGTSSAIQELPASASQPSLNHPIPSYFPSSFPIQAGPESSSFADDDIIKTAMDSAERAISSVKTVKKEKESEKHDDGVMAQNGPVICSETDLTAVFHAWYSAGFYTGKYLVEQSHPKKL
ncbi:hypothetical protein SDJN03_09896, partial [Cucurbita argyrosperma subsp. sororia]